MASPLATIGILSIGQMGLGVAELLVAHNYRVLTNVSGRSTATQDRAKAAQLGLVDTDAELVDKCDYVLSIVPPRDAVATARRIIDGFKKSGDTRKGKEPLYYLDLNAISPTTVSGIHEAFAQDAPHVRFVDGGIIGAPPSRSNPTSSEWKKPGIPLSGPFPLSSAPISGPGLAEVLNTQHLGEEIGSASGLKCCFAALSKGFTALALQSFSTASSLGVLPQLERYLEWYNPGAALKAKKGITGCPSKAYRWVEEMHQIGECFEEDGGWPQQARVFREIAGVFGGLAKVVESRGGASGMGEVEGVMGALQDGLRIKQRERRLSVEELEQEDR